MDKLKIAIYQHYIFAFCFYKIEKINKNRYINACGAFLKAKSEESIENADFA